MKTTLLTAVALVTLAAPAGARSWQITWRVDNQQVTGLGLTSNAGRLLIASMVRGSHFGVVGYEIRPDGTMRGTYTADSRGGEGEQTLTPIRR